MTGLICRALFAMCILVQLAFAQTNSKMSSSDALVGDLDAAKSLGGLGRMLIAQDGRTRRWADYCGESLAASNRGEFREAVRQSARALSIGERTGDNEAMFFASRDLTYAYFLAGDTENALVWMERTDAAFKAVGFRDASQAASPQLIRSKLLFGQGKFKEALEAAIKSQESLPYFGAGDRIDAARLEAASAHIALGNEAAALKVIQEIAKSRDALNKSRALSEWAKLSLRAGQTTEAKRLATQAVAEAEKEGLLVRAGLLKTLAGIQLQTEDKPGALLSYAQAIALITQSRGKFSSQAVRSGLLSSNQQLFDDAIDLAMEMNQPDKAILWSETSRSQLMLDQLRERQAIKLPEFVNLEALLKQSSQSQFLGFHSSAKNTHAWMIEGGSVRAQTMKVGKKELAKMVDLLRNQIIAGGKTSHAAALALHDALILPLKPALATPMVVIPSGPLHLLPFQALRNNGGWLGQQIPIRYEMSLTSAVAAPSNPGRESLFAVGNPTLSKDEYSLPGSELEVNAIKAFFPQATVAMRTDATRGKFMAEAGKAGFVHAAAHVTLDELDPMLSALKLSAIGKESGDVHASDFLKLDLNQVNLVALSACNSGMGRIAPGDEFYGFKRSIMLSGAKALALTYWAVDDDSTAALMTLFYKHLREGKLPGHIALHKAQTEMMQSAKFSEPYHWASFMLVGSF